MTVRRNPITGEPILFAPERATRPGAFGGERASRCPFCPQHEGDTPPAISSIGDPWRVRVVPNKYPPVTGAEVIIESPVHGATFGAIDDAEEVVRTYIDRYRAHTTAPYTAVFKNEGPRAGTSVPHVHSQVMPLPFVPPRVLRESEGFASAASCPLCDVDGEAIRETTSFRWLTPHASSSAYQQWLVPKRHVAEMSKLRDDEIAQLSALLRSASAAMLTLGSSYNWILMNFPRDTRAHFYVDLIPRLTTLAGFELGSGTFVEIVDPADAARRLRIE
jgi:UDPglucose--hexose-1-phosphate uridylyltransferase